MKLSESMLTNAGVMWVSKLLQLFPQLFIVPYLIKTTGDKGYGVYVLIWSLVMGFDQLEKALQSGVVKYSASELALENNKALGEILSTSFVLSIVLAIIVSIAIGVFVSLSEIINGYYLLSPFLVLVPFLLYPASPFTGYLQAKQAFYINSIFELASKYLSLAVLVIIFSVANPDIEIAIFVLLLFFVLTRMIQIPIALRRLNGTCVSLRNFKPDRIKVLISFGVYSLLIAICLVTNDTGLRWLMGYLEGEIFVSRLAISLIPVFLLYQIVSPISLIVMPASSFLKSAEKASKLNELFVRGGKYTAIIIAISLLGAFLLIEQGLYYWLGDEYVYLSKYCLILLCASSIMWVSNVSHHILKGIGKIKLVVVIYGVTWVLIPFLYILITYGHYGDKLLMIVSALSSGYVLCGMLTIYYACRSMNLSVWSVSIKVYSPLFLMIPFLVVIELIRTVEFSGVDVMVSVLLLAIIFVVYAALNMSLLFKKPEKEQILDASLSIFTRFKRMSMFKNN